MGSNMTLEEQLQVERLRKMQQAEEAREQREHEAIEESSHEKAGRRIWAIPEFTPRNEEVDYIAEKIRLAIPEYELKLFINSVDGVTEDDIMSIVQSSDDEQLKVAGDVPFRRHNPGGLLTVRVEKDGETIETVGTTGFSVVEEDGEYVVKL